MGEAHRSSAAACPGGAERGVPATTGKQGRVRSKQTGIWGRVGGSRSSVLCTARTSGGLISDSGGRPPEQRAGGGGEHSLPPAKPQLTMLSDSGGRWLPSVPLVPAQMELPLPPSPIRPPGLPLWFSVTVLVSLSLTPPRCCRAWTLTSPHPVADPSHQSRQCHM